MFIKWGNSCSTKFRVTNGVKEEGILSPALFNVYMCSILTKGSTCRKNKKIRFLLILIEQVITNLLKQKLAF